MFKRRYYETLCAPSYKSYTTIFHRHLPKYNYTFVPHLETKMLFTLANDVKFAKEKQCKIKITTVKKLTFFCGYHKPITNSVKNYGTL